MDTRIIKILIIEDDPLITLVYQDLMDASIAADFKCDICTSLASGMDAIRNNSYDVLLLDLNLPDSDHQNTVLHIPELSDRLPIVVMTSTNDELLALKTMNMGGQDYLIKNKLDQKLFIRSMLYAIERHELKRDLKLAKKKSDDLLLNILPAEIAEELKEKGRAEARNFDKVTIIFTDFKSFTEQSAKLSAADLVNELNHCFEAFDGIMEKYGIEKIKTIGDAYMAVGGLPVPTDDSTKNSVLVALEIQEFIQKRKADHDLKGEAAFEMRVGIHTGPVVAGIVGLKKFQYDIWGDAVNTASRMESCGEVGKVNISQSTYELLKDDPDFEFKSRGKIEAKGKGEIEMYFVSKT